MQEFINFPQDFPETERIKICKMLDEKDIEIKGLYKEIIGLENKLERFNGSLTWKESENLKTQMAIANNIKEQIYKGLELLNLRATESFNKNSPNAIDIKISHIGLIERFSKWLKSLIKFKIVRN